MSKIRYKAIIHEVSGYAPFTGALIVANDWDSEFSDDTIEKYLEMNTVAHRGQTMIEQVLRNDNNKGVILAGLDWTLQLKDMLEIVDLVSKTRLDLLINVPVDLDTLMLMIGKHTLETTKSTHTLDSYESKAEKDSITMLMGSVYMDYITKEKDITIIAGLDNPKVYNFLKGDSSNVKN